MKLPVEENTDAYASCDLIPNVLRGAEPLTCRPPLWASNWICRCFYPPLHCRGYFIIREKWPLGKAAEKFGTLFGLSSLGTASIEDIGSTIRTPKLFQLYVHKDKALTQSMIDRCKAADFDAMALTVDTTVGGNRERDLRTGFTVPPRLTLKKPCSVTQPPNLDPELSAEREIHPASVRELCQ